MAALSPDDEPVKPQRRRRWPAYVLAVLLLGYAVGKVLFAAEGKLGFPGGPPVSAAEHARYAREVLDVAAAQWLAAITGVVGALLVIATVTSIGRHVPRAAMLVMLACLFVGVGAGAGTVIVDGFGGPGPGWSWHHGVVGLVVIGLLAATINSYVQSK